MTRTVTIFLVHGQPYSLAAGKARQRLGFLLDRLESIIPQSYYLVHWRGGGRESLLGAIGVQHGVIMSQETILDLNLGCQEMREQREDGGQKAGQTVSQMIIRSLICLRSSSQVGLGL